MLAVLVGRRWQKRSSGGQHGDTAAAVVLNGGGSSSAATAPTHALHNDLFIFLGPQYRGRTSPAILLQGWGTVQYCMRWERDSNTNKKRGNGTETQ